MKCNVIKVSTKKEKLIGVKPNELFINDSFQQQRLLLQ